MDPEFAQRIVRSVNVRQHAIPELEIHADADGHVVVVFHPVRRVHRNVHHRSRSHSEFACPILMFGLVYRGVVVHGPKPLELPSGSTMRSL